MDKVADKSWVEIHQVVLTKEERAPGIPEDTKGVPLELRLKGFLEGEAQIGDEVYIKTPIGRRIKGQLIAVNPPFKHDFGAPIKELLTIGQGLKKELREGGNLHGG